MFHEFPMVFCLFHVFPMFFGVFPMFFPCFSHGISQISPISVPAVPGRVISKARSRPNQSGPSSPLRPAPTSGGPWNKRSVALVTATIYTVYIRISTHLYLFTFISIHIYIYTYNYIHIYLLICFHDLWPSSRFHSQAPQGHRWPSAAPPFRGRWDLRHWLRPGVDDFGDWCGEAVLCWCIDTEKIPVLYS